MPQAKFEKQTYGATVATILETDDSIVEVQERNDGTYGLIVHHRRCDRDSWDDLTAYLKPEHFELLGSVARRMLGETSQDKFTSERSTKAVGEAPFEPEDFAYTATLLRDYCNTNPVAFRAVCSNNLNIILAALDRQAGDAADATPNH